MLDSYGEKKEKFIAHYQQCAAQDILASEATGNKSVRQEGEVNALMKKQCVKEQLIQNETQEERLLPFVIRRDGRWFYRESEIKRKELLCLFASFLKRDEEGHYWLETPTESGKIHVEDVPFLAVEMDFRGHSHRQTICLRTNMDQLLCVGEEHPLICDWNRHHDQGSPPYIFVKEGSGDHPILARVSRAVWLELAALAVEGHIGDAPCLGVWSRGCFFPLSRLSEACSDTDDA